MIKSEYMEQVAEIVKYKTQAQHYMRVLEDTKAAIQIAMDNFPEMKIHFRRIMGELDANGVICCFDKKKVRK